MVLVSASPSLVMMSPGLRPALSAAPPRLQVDYRDADRHVALAMVAVPAPAPAPSPSLTVRPTAETMPG